MPTPLPVSPGQGAACIQASASTNRPRGGIRSPEGWPRAGAPTPRCHSTGSPGRFTTSPLPRHWLDGASKAIPGPHFIVTFVCKAHLSAPEVGPGSSSLLPTHGGAFAEPWLGPQGAQPGAHDPGHTTETQNLQMHDPEAHDLQTHNTRRTTPRCTTSRLRTSRHTTRGARPLGAQPRDAQPPDTHSRVHANLGRGQCIASHRPFTHGHACTRRSTRSRHTDPGEPESAGPGRYGRPCPNGLAGRPAHTQPSGSRAGEL